MKGQLLINLDTLHAHLAAAQDDALRVYEADRVGGSSASSIADNRAPIKLIFAPPKSKN